MQHIFFFLFIIVPLTLASCTYEGHKDAAKRGQVAIGSDSYDLGQSTLSKLRGSGDRFQINLYQSNIEIRLGQKNRVEIQNQRDKAYVDIRFFAIHSSTQDVLSPGMYTLDTPAANDFEFGGAEMLLANANNLPAVASYQMQSGTLEVISASETGFNLLWKMTFLNESDSTDVISCTGSYSGGYLYSQL